MVRGKTEPDLLEVTVPSIRFLGIDEPFTLQFEKEYLKLAVRVIVVWCTFLLFKDRMKRAWRVMFGDNDEARQQEILERVAKLEAERERAKGGSSSGAGRKNIAVATGSTGAAASPSEKAGAKRRKA